MAQSQNVPEHQIFSKIDPQSYTAFKEMQPALQAASYILSSVALHQQEALKIAIHTINICKAEVDYRLTHTDKEATPPKQSNE